MPLAPITAIYAALLGLLILVLALRVVRARRRHGVGLGTGGNADVEHAMRVQANCIEYVPIALLLIGLLELNQASAALLHGLGGVLLLARLLHAWGFSGNTGISSGRVGGTVLTWGTIIIAAIANLYQVFR